MADKPKKNGRQNYDWNAIKNEYIISKISLKDLSDKHGIRYRTVAERSRTEGWVKERKKHLELVARKATKKVATMQANQLAKELDIADRISNVLKKALDDADQFNRHLVETRTKMGGTEVSGVEEKVFSKTDMRALKDAAQTLKIVEEMKRSLLNIQKTEEINRERREQRRLEMEEERLQMQKQQMDQAKPDKNITVTIKGYEEGWGD